MAKIDEIRALADQMIDNDNARDSAFGYYQDMFHLRWELPRELKNIQWIHKFVSTDAHDAVASGVRVLSSLKPYIRKHPLASDQANRQIANQTERVLSWCLWNADRRRSRGVVADVVQSALLYDAVALNVVDLENELRVRDKMGTKNLRRLRNAVDSGRFVVQVFNPMDVHVMRSTYGVEAVLLCQKKLASEVVLEWGNMADGLKALADKGEMINYYDFCDYEYRAVWVGPSAYTAGASDLQTILAPDKHDMEFLPWAALMGGTSLEGYEEFKYHPMLFPLYFSQSWDTMNVIKTLRMSEAIAHAAAPRLSDEGPNQVEAQIDYGDPMLIAKPAPGNTLRPLAPPPIDQGLGQIADEIAGDIQRATVSRILTGGDIPSGTAYSTLNLATQTAVGSLKPAKELAEKALAEMFKLMLMWVRHTGKPLLAYGSERRSQSYGDNYVIEAEDIDPGALYLEVELIADVPTDRLQRANAASIMVQFGYPKEYALEDLGVDDPQTAMRQWYYEKFVEQMFSNWQQEQNNGIQLDFQAKMQEVQMQAQMMAQQAMQQEQQQQAMPPGMGGMPPGAMPMMPEDEGAFEMEGQGWNPAMGGTPAVMAGGPEMLRENVAGQTFTGEAPGFMEV